MKILNFPLTKIFFGVITGILLFRIYPCPIYFILIGIFIASLGLTISFYHYRKNHLYSTLFGCFVLILSVIIGISTAYIHKENKIHNHYTNQIKAYEKVYKFELLLTEKLKKTQKNYRFIGHVKEINDEKSCGKIILNIAIQNAPKEYKIGTHLKVLGTIYKNKIPLNPNAFDYSRYLENKEIYAQLYTKQDLIEIGQFESSIWSHFSNFRETIISNLEHSSINKEELNVLIALILGQQQDISPEIIKDYQWAGAVHVLSVSGLHVGFIMLFISFMIRPISNTRNGALLKLFIVLISLWSFAILAGLSPSIVRSVTMFSFLAIGNHLRRSVNIYHTLLVSMLLILLFNPSFLFDVGFQLSYIALFFIIWLQPILSSLWEPKNKILKYFWDIITVSFAAQIGTMPLSIYYFHQFPGLFFLTNLLILPLLGLIMAVGVLAVVIAAFHTLPEFIGKSIEFLIAILNSIIHWIASIDSLVFKNISFSTTMFWCSYLVIIIMILWFKKPNFKRLVMTFLSIILFQVMTIIQKNEIENNEEFILFNIHKNSVMTQRKGDEVTVFSNDSILENMHTNWHIQSYLIGNFCTVKSKKPIQNLMYIDNKKILIIDSTCIFTKKIQPDILIVIQSPKLNMQRLLKTVKPKVVVVDDSNFKSYVQLWKESCRKEKIPFHATCEKGFYKI